MVSMVSEIMDVWLACLVQLGMSFVSTVSEIQVSMNIMISMIIEIGYVGVGMVSMASVIGDVWLAWLVWLGMFG